ncbi:SGNH/GDSL hydrolase family protein [Aromatoleum aromaticum]|uniref:SGNH/GDSL hydrolase family protein n=1 Tax=Aromatoleum aromaticum TaxID=551760 RepID=UPI00145939D3|nr:SGNH/GDSL hydrolase family protein [Aromatoleum aromaticum]
MHMSSVLRSMLLLALAPVTALAAPFSNIYFFGDSLSDTGNDFLLSSAIHAGDPSFPIVPDPIGYPASGQFSNGPVYSELFASRLGFDVQPSRLGGTNYAYGGAGTGSVILPFSSSFSEQVQQYVEAPGAADPGALYVLFIGSNDVEDILAGAPPAATIEAAIGRIGMAVEALALEGVGHFLIPNVPDLGLVPATTGNGAIARNEEATAASLAFNTALAVLLDSLGHLDLRTFDTFALLNDAVMNPSTYGLTDAQHWCQRETGIAADGQPLYELLCSEAEADRHLFWDYTHPTTAGHRVLADALFAALQIPEPGTFALLLAALGAASLARRASSSQAAAPRAQARAPRFRLRAAPPRRAA